MPWQPPIVVHPFTSEGERPISVRGSHIGHARSDHELLEVLRAAGLDEADAALDDPHLVEWRGPGPHVWTPPETDGGA
ncbi:hypothetical protein [Streptomyces sp. Da 82-17]|uniref:hypothetical protein n=1 Tax=Streptomyces sp. Da 82-17 TaxID=3377116 RepID=UPI0038D44A2E